MNELIKKLAEQAKKCAWAAMANATDQKQGLKVYAETYDSKFAELVIKECMSCAQFVGITNNAIGLGPGPIRYTSMVNDQIKKHFGVE